MALHDISFPSYGQELAYVEVAADISITGGSSGAATTWVDLGNVYMDGSTVYLLCATPQLVISANGNMILEIKEDGVSLGSGSATRMVQTGGAPGYDMGWSFMSPRWTPAIGVHSYKLVGYHTAGTAQIYGSNSGIYRPSWAALMKVTK